MAKTARYLFCSLRNRGSAAACSSRTSTPQAQRWLEEQCVFIIPGTYKHETNNTENIIAHSIHFSELFVIRIVHVLGDDHRVNDLYFLLCELRPPSSIAYSYMSDVMWCDVNNKHLMQWWITVSPSSHTSPLVFLNLASMRSIFEQQIIYHKLKNLTKLIPKKRTLTSNKGSPRKPTLGSASSLAWQWQGNWGVCWMPERDSESLICWEAALNGQP